MDQLQYLDEYMQQYIFKIELPSVLRDEVLRELQKMNINKVSLFSDLDGYTGALTIKYRYRESASQYFRRSLEMAKAYK